MSARVVQSVPLALAAWVAAFTLASVPTSCAREPAVAATAPLDPGAEARVEAPAAVKAASVGDGDEVRVRRQRLAAAFHGHRCVLTGSVLPSEGAFGAAEYADTATFEAAWATEATVAPGWAAEAAMASYRDGCGPKAEAVDGLQE